MADTEESHLLMFYGTECTHCHEMEPLVKQLEETEKIVVQRLEVWHDDKNMVVYKEYDQGKCGGVPFFFNKKTEQWICGSVDYEKLKVWAFGS